MTLDQYFMMPNSLTPLELARVLGRSKSYISLVRSGKLTPSAPACDQIIRATGGLVTLQDLIPQDRKLTLNLERRDASCEDADPSAAA